MDGSFKKHTINIPYKVPSLYPYGAPFWSKFSTTKSINWFVVHWFISCWLLRNSSHEEYMLIVQTITTDIIVNGITLRSVLYIMTPLFFYYACKCKSCSVILALVPSTFSKILRKNSEAKYHKGNLCVPYRSDLDWLVGIFHMNILLYIIVLRHERQ